MGILRKAKYLAILPVIAAVVFGLLKAFPAKQAGVLLEQEVQLQKQPAIIEIVGEKLAQLTPGWKCPGPETNPEFNPAAGMFEPNESWCFGQLSEEDLQAPVAVVREFPLAGTIEVDLPTGRACVQSPSGYVFEQIVAAEPELQITPEVTPIPTPPFPEEAEGVVAQVVPESKFTPLWQNFLPILTIVAFWLFIWKLWIRITKPQMIEAWEFEFTFRGGGGATVETRPTIKQVPEPGALARAREVGYKEAMLQLRTVIEDMISIAAGQITVFESSYDNVLRSWQGQVNGALAQRVQGLPYDTNLLARLERVEKGVGRQVVALDFSELEYDGQALAMLQEEADRRRKATEQTVSTAYLQYCFANGLNPEREDVFKTWAEMEMRRLDAEVRGKEVQAQLVRAQAFSELLEELSPEDIFRSIEQIIGRFVTTRSSRKTAGRSVQNILGSSEPIGEEA